MWATGLLLLTAASASDSPRFKKIFTVFFENTDYEVAMQQDFFKYIASVGRSYTNMHGIAHPSQPNYLGFIAGSHCGRLTDDNVDIEARTVVDLLEVSGFTWKSYAENYPGNCFTGHDSHDMYVRKHNPFISFNNIRNNPERCAKIVDDQQFFTDIKDGQLPDYMYFAPNQINDGHDVVPFKETSSSRIAKGSEWLSNLLTPLLTNPLFQETLFVITFDENDAYTHRSNPSLLAENRIYTVLLGAGVQPGSTDDNYYDHFSGLALLEQEWCLGNLGKNDSVAVPFSLSDGDSKRYCEYTPSFADYGPYSPDFTHYDGPRKSASGAVSLVKNIGLNALWLVWLSSIL